MVEFGEFMWELFFMLSAVICCLVAIGFILSMIAALFSSEKVPIDDSGCTYDAVNMKWKPSKRTSKQRKELLKKQLKNKIT